MWILLFNIKKKEGKSQIIWLWPSNWDQDNMLFSFIHLMQFFCKFISSLCGLYWFSLYIAQLASSSAIVIDYTPKPSLKFYHLANVNVGYKSKVVSRSARINHNHWETSALLMVLQQHHFSTYIRNYDFMIKLLLLLEGIKCKY